MYQWGIGVFFDRLNVFNLISETDIIIRDCVTGGLGLLGYQNQEEY